MEAMASCPSCAAFFVHMLPEEDPSSCSFCTYFLLFFSFPQSQSGSVMYCEEFQFSKTPLIILFCNKSYFSYSLRYRIPMLAALVFLLRGLTWLPRRKPLRRTECWSVHPYLSPLFRCFQNYVEET